MLHKIKCITSYDGTNFYGYQKQIDLRSVQGEIEKALEKMHKEPIKIHASGRTDAGVHALGQVFHFETPLAIEPDKWKRALNSMLPKDIYIKQVEVVDASFHARFDVSCKEYHYLLTQEEYNPIKSNYICFHDRPLDINKMRQAIKLFVGRHDFTSFTSNNETDDKVRVIYETALVEKGKELHFIFRGNGFLRYQIRIMVGTLIEIGEGKRDVYNILDLFECKDRTKAGLTAEPQGLYLVKVEY